MEKHEVFIGMKVTCKKKEEAYYSGYAGNPKCFFLPGMKGTVIGIHAPSVLLPGMEFAIVEFQPLPEICVGVNTPEPHTWKVALTFPNIKPFKEAPSTQKGTPK